MKYGFVKVAAAIPKVRVADCNFNTQETLTLISQAEKEGAEIVVFPELGITSCSCGDIFRQPTLLKGAENAISKILKETNKTETIILIGSPIATGSTLLNCTLVLWKGEIIGAVPQYYTPITGEGATKRWFTPGAEIKNGTITTICGRQVELHKKTLFTTPTFTFAIETGSDLRSPIPPSNILSLQGAEIIFCLAAEGETAGSHKKLINTCLSQSERCTSGYIYTSSGYGEASGDTVFAGNAVIAESGKILKQSERFSLDSRLIISEIDVEKVRHDRMRNSYFADARKEYADDVATIYIEQQSNKSSEITRTFDSQPFIPQGKKLEERCNEIFNIQSAGLAKRIEHTHASTCVIGISGGLDSTLAILVSVAAFDKLGKDRKEIIAITMPGFGTTDRTYNNAIALMQSLGVTIEEISIKDACLQHFKDIGHDADIHDVTYENAQARERTQILMDIANKRNGLVVGTGDLSELALGWATYNGDHMSMYSVNATVPKTLIKYIVRHIATNSNNETTRTTLLDIIDTPISPELIPADEKGNIKQKTADLVGPYELHDFFLYHMLRNAYSPSKIYFIAQKSFEGKYDNETIKKWLKTFYRRFFIQQFKRSCMPDGAKVGSCSLSPRGDWAMPTDACFTMWTAECETLA